MDNNTVVGLVISALVVLVGLFISLATPLLKLNKTITKLDISVDNLYQQIKKNEAKVNELEIVLKQHQNWLQTDKQRLDNHEERIKNLDHQVGYVDKKTRED